MVEPGDRARKSIYATLEGSSTAGGAGRDGGDLGRYVFRLSGDESIGCPSTGPVVVRVIPPTLPARRVAGATAVQGGLCAQLRQAPQAPWGAAALLPPLPCYYQELAM